jgi:hypothetical protein
VLLGGSGLSGEGNTGGPEDNGEAEDCAAKEVVPIGA